MKVVLLGAPQKSGDGDCWHDDMVEGGRQLGWQVDYLQVLGAPVDDLVRASKGADLLIWTRTHGHDPDGDAEAMLRRIEDAGTVTAGVHFDLYWSLPRREVRVGNEPWWTCQYVFTADGGARDWAGRGVNHTWLPPAFGTRFLGRGTPRPPARAAVFVGSCVRGIHGQHRIQMLEWAKRRWSARFRHLGSGQRNKIWGRAVNDVFAGARVVLGDSAPADYYWSDRIPRTLGRGGLLCYPHTPGLDGQGFTGEVMLRFDRFDFEGLGRRIDALTDTRRREMTDAAITLVQERHLMRHRMLTIAETAGLA